MSKLSLSKPPLKELSLAIEFAPVREMDEISLGAFLKKRFDGKGTMQIVRRQTLTVGGADGTVARDTGFGGGVVDVKTDNSQIGFLVDRLVYTKRAPYTKWEDIVSAVDENWDLLASDFSVGPITRVSVRCINLIELAIDGTRDFKDVISMTPPGSDELGAGYCVGFHYEETQYYKKSDVFVSVDRFYRMRHSMSSAPSQRENPVRLDVKVMRNFDPAALPKCVSPEVYSDLRTAKNAAFVNALSPSQLERYR